jgi:hypothetical protein
LRGAAQIGLAVGPALTGYKVKKHFEVQITDASLHFFRKSAQIEGEAALDGIYVLRTSVLEQELDAPGVVHSYKQLRWAERAFGILKGPLEVRPIHHRLADRVRAHLFSCMLSYYLEWHLREAWAGADLSRSVPAHTARLRRQGAALGVRYPQGTDQAHLPWRSTTQLREPDCRARPAHPKYGAAQRLRGPLRAAQRADRVAGQSTGAARAHPQARVDTNETAARAGILSAQAELAMAVGGNFGLTQGDPSQAR